MSPRILHSFRRLVFQRKDMSGRVRARNVEPDFTLRCIPLPLPPSPFPPPPTPPFFSPVYLWQASLVPDLVVRKRAVKGEGGHPLEKVVHVYITAFLLLAITEHARWL